MFNDKLIDNMSNEELKLLIKDNSNIKLDISGPYEVYKSLLDTRIFEEIASVSPNVSFIAIVKGRLSNGDVELKNKILHLEYYESV